MAPYRVVVAIDGTREDADRLFDFIEGELENARIATTMVLQEPATVACERAARDMMADLRRIASKCDSFGDRPADALGIADIARAAIAKATAQGGPAQADPAVAIHAKLLKALEGLLKWAEQADADLEEAGDDRDTWEIHDANEAVAHARGPAAYGAFQALTATGRDEAQDMIMALFDGARAEQALAAYDDARREAAKKEAPDA